MPSPSEPSPAFQAADRFYFDHLRAMLGQMGQAAAAAQTRDHLRLFLDSEARAGANTALKLKLTQKLTGYHLRLNAQDGTVLSWYVDFLAVEGDQSMPVEEATALARDTARPPDTARLQFAGYENIGGRTVFRAYWVHEHEGLPVEGDFIEVLVNGRARRCFSYAHSWREPHLSPTPVPR